MSQRYSSQIACLCLLIFASILSAYAATEGNIARAMFTTGIVDREPVNRALILDDTVETVFFFTDIRDMQGQEITHRWEYNGRVVSEKTFSVEGERWRTHSSMELRPSQTGTWTVVVLDGKGWALHAEVFKYMAYDAKSIGAVILPLDEE